MPHCRICLILRGIFSVAVLIIPPGCMRSPTPETNVSASNDGKTVNLQLYSFTGVASSDYSQMVDEHHGYLSEFGAFVQAQCGISPNLFRVPPPKVITVDVGSTRFSDPHSNGPRDKLDSKYREFPFKFFQQELFVLLEKNRKVFDREKNLEISVLMVESLEGNCGFALPAVQFDPSLGGSSSRDVVKLLKNRVLIDTAPDQHRDCGGRKRILFHELGHLLVQDDPPHLCKSANGVKAPCARENLMASFVWVRAPRRPRPGEGGGVPFGGGDPSGLRQVRAQGTELTQDQCEAVKKTLEDL